MTLAPDDGPTVFGTATRALSAVEYRDRPRSWQNVLDAMEADLRRQMAKAHQRPVGRPHLSLMWGRPVGHAWHRTTERHATARVAHMTWLGTR